MSNPIDRLPPQNVEAEEAVLGSCLMDPEAIHAVRAIAKAGDFYRTTNATIYQAMVSLANHHEPVDMVTVADKLTQAGILDDVGGTPYLSHLVGVVPTALHADHYARIVERTALRRRVIGNAGKIAAAAYDEMVELDALRSQVMTLCTEALASGGRNRVLTPDDLADEWVEMLVELAMGGGQGVATGFADLDKIIGGLQPGQLAVLLADTSVGKSAWALSLARNVGAKHHPTMFASVEMSERQLIARLASAFCGAPFRQIAHYMAKNEGSEQLKAAIGKAEAEFRKCGIHVFYKPALRTVDIRTVGMEWKARHKVELLVVDYLQIVTPEDPKASRVQQVGAICRDLKRIAGELGVPVVALCQLNRELTGRTDKRPSLHDARESGSIEQDSDILMGLYRDDFYFRGMNEKKQPVVAGKAELLVLKHRDGPTGTINLTWKAGTAEYVNWKEEPNEGATR